MQDAKRNITFYIKPSTRDEFYKVANSEHLSAQELFEKFITNYHTAKENKNDN